MSVENPVRLLASGVFSGLLVFFSGPTTADSASPFLTRDQNPLLVIYGLPTATAARLITTGQSRFTTSLNMSNTINGESRGNESLFVDAESYQLNLVYDLGLNDDWMFRLHIPFIKHSAGFMDDWIDDYHDLLGLPEDIRPFYPNDQIDIRYSFDGNSLLLKQNSSAGLGDISLQLAYQAIRQKDANVSYWLSLKLPSGDSDKLTGSGAADLAVWLAGDTRLVNDLWWYGNIGALFMDDSEVLSEKHRNSALFASTGIQFQPWTAVQLRFQLDTHSAFYDTDTDFLGPVIQLTFGGSIILSQHSSLDLAIAEDIQTGASPDVNFNISWRRLID